MTWLVEQDLLVVIFCNQSYGQSPLFEIIEEKVMAILFGDTFQVPATRAASQWNVDDLSRYQGSYELSDGGRIVAEVANGALQLTAIDQKAIDALLFPGGTAPYSGLNERARALVEAAMAGEIGPFETELGEGDRAIRFQRAIVRQIRQVEQMTEEKVTGVEIVGTVPYMADGVVATGLRFRTASGEHGQLSVMWRDGGLVGLDMLMFTPTVPFVPAPDEGTLAGYHLVWAKPFTANFRGEGRAVTGLDLGGGKIANRTN
jgi:hypothetical protein